MAGAVMATETVQVKRETVESWTLRADAERAVVHVTGPRSAGQYKEALDFGFPADVQSAYLRLRETIRPLKSGTSDDGTPWGEVRVEGEAPVMCGYEGGALPFADVNGRRMHGCEDKPFLWWSAQKEYQKDTWAAPAAKWFAANPWPVKQKDPVTDYARMTPDEVRAVEGGIVSHIGAALGQMFYPNMGHVLDGIKELKSDRDDWKARAENAAKAADQNMSSLLRQERANHELTRERDRAINELATIKTALSAIRKALP